MTIAYKMKNLNAAASFARRLLDLQPKPEIGTQVRAQDEEAQRAQGLMAGARRPLVLSPSLPPPQRRPRQPLCARRRPRCARARLLSFAAPHPCRRARSCSCASRRPATPCRSTTTTATPLSSATPASCRSTRYGRCHSLLSLFTDLPRLLRRRARPHSTLNARPCRLVPSASVRPPCAGLQARALLLLRRLVQARVQVAALQGVRHGRGGRQCHRARLLRQPAHRLGHVISARRCGAVVPALVRRSTVARRGQIRPPLMTLVSSLSSEFGDYGCAGRTHCRRRLSRDGRCAARLSLVQLMIWTLLGAR